MQRSMQALTANEKYHFNRDFARTRRISPNLFLSEVICGDFFFSHPALLRRFWSVQLLQRFLIKAGKNGLRFSRLSADRPR